MATKWLKGFKVVVPLRDKSGYRSLYDSIAEAVVRYIPDVPVRRRDRFQGPLAVFMDRDRALEFAGFRKARGAVVLACRYEQSRQRYLRKSYPRFYPTPGYERETKQKDYGFPLSTDFANVVIVEGGPLSGVK